MSLTLKVATGCLLACGLVWAAPPACVIGTLSAYIALGAPGCTLNGDVFANFSYRASASGDAATIAADQIIVAPLVAVPATAKLTFSGPWKVDPAQTQDSVITYTIVPPPGGAVPSQLSLTLGSALVRGIIGSVTVNESTNVGRLRVFVNCTEVCRITSHDSVMFDPVSVVLVTTHVSLSGGTGGASLTEFGAALDRCMLCV